MIRSHALGRVAALAVALFVATSSGAFAEATQIRLGFQAGIPHLPVIVMKQAKLVEKHLKAVGLENVSVTWYQLVGTAQADALLSSTLDFTSGGVGELANLWSATGGKVKSIGAEGGVPNYLVTTNPKIKSIKDFGPGDRIAVPAIKVSPQAVMLQLAADRAFGDPTKLDTLTVTMSHADAAVALLSGGGQIDSHFSVPPYQEQELANPKIHRVLSAQDILGGPSTLVVMNTTQKFYDENPTIVKAVTAALAESIEFIKKDKSGAAKIFLDQANDAKNTPESIVRLLNDPGTQFSTTPRNVMTFVNFMAKQGAIKNKPASWKDLFFPNVASAHGS